MKKFLYVLAALLSVASHPGIASDIPQEGKPAPSFTLPDQDGKDISLKDYLGKWVVLYFYPKDFSGGCTLEAHNFQSDIEKYRAKNAVIIGVSGDSSDSHKGFCAKQGLDFKLLSDSKHSVSDIYGSVMKRDEVTYSARNTFLIDPKGFISKAYTKVIPAGHDKEVLADLARLQAAGR